jgi:hypothetical protein
MNSVQVGIAQEPKVFKALGLTVCRGLVLDDSLLGGDGAVRNILS